MGQSWPGKSKDPDARHFETVNTKGIGKYEFGKAMPLEMSWYPDFLSKSLNSATFLFFNKHFVIR